MLRIRNALPHIFEKSYPVLEPKTQMLSAMSLLRFHEIDVLPLSFDAARGQRQKVVYGYSALAKLLVLGPKRFGSFLKQPCEEASEPLAIVRADRGLSALLDTFAKTRFGFARIEEAKTVGALAGLSDVLAAYETDMVATNLVVSDVGTPRFSLPGNTSLRNALEEMFKKKYRRLFISEARGGGEFVSDREIIGYVFSPSILSAMVQDGESEVLDTPISGIERMTARNVAPGTTIKAAAQMLRQEKAGQCLIFNGMVATPWDLVMKPWKAKTLNIG